MDFLTTCWQFVIWALTTFDYQAVGSFMSDAWQSDFVRMTSAFTCAAIIHQRGMKKQIALAVTSLSMSIDNLTKTVSQDLSKHSKALSDLKNNYDNINTRVSKLETLNEGDKENGSNEIGH